MNCIKISACCTSGPIQDQKVLRLVVTVTAKGTGARGNTCYEYPQDCPPQDWLLAGQSWGGQFLVHQSSGISCTD